jgi:GTP-binding protein
LHLVSSTQDDIYAAYSEVREELTAFGAGLFNKYEVIVLSKIDLISDSEREIKIDLLTRKTGKQVLSVSVEDPDSLAAFSRNLSKLLKQHVG